MNKKETFKTFTAEEVAEAAAKNKCEIIHVEVFFDTERKKKPEERERAAFLIKDPMTLEDLDIMSAILALENKFEVGQYLLDNCWVDGDERFLKDKLVPNNPRARFTAAIEAANAIERYDAAVVKH